MEKYSDEEMLEAIREHPGLTMREWRSQHILPCVRSITVRFGSWNEARRKAGLKSVRKRKRKKWSKENIIEEIQKRSEEDPPLAGENDALARAARDHFGSWKEALRASGFEVKSKKEKIKDRLFKEGVITSSDYQGVTEARDFLDQDESIRSISLLGGQGNKYGMGKMLDISVQTRVYFTDEESLAGFLIDHIRFDLNEDLEMGKKIALTVYLEDKVPDKVFRYIHSLYSKGSFSWEEEEGEEE